MEMHQVRYFLAAARHLNFTRAAAELNVAQPSLTRAIQNLEGELGGLLFRRERSNTHLTELGRLMLPHLQATFAAAEAARVEARRLRRRDVGALSLGVSAGIDSATPAALVLDTVARLRNVDVSVEVTTSDAIERRLMAGEFDAAVVSGIEGDHPRFDLRPIGRDTLVVAFSPDHRFGRQAAVRLAGLHEEPMIVLSGSPFDGSLSDAMTIHGLNRVIRHSANDPAWIAEFVRNGLGCAVIPRATAVSQSLPHRPIEDVPVEHDTMLATVAGRRHSAALATLIERIADRVPLR